MKYTDQQDLAIRRKTANIIVSAGAGSGKTGVLKERVIHHLKQGVNIDELIILTFTNAAAFEMKSRIIEAIKEDDSLAPQLAKINLAIISTFDAFCLKLVKKYHYLLGLPANIGIGDKIQLLQLETDVLDQCISGYYQVDDPQFDELVISLFQKGDRIIYETVAMLGNKLLKEPNYDKMIDEFQLYYFSDPVLNRRFGKFELQIRESLAFSKNQLSELIQALERYDHPSVVGFISDLVLIVEPLFKEIAFDDLLSRLLDLQFPRKPSIRGDEALKAILKDYYDPLRDELKKNQDIFKGLFISNKVEAINNVKKTKDMVLKLLEITRKYLGMLSAKKQQRNLFSYGDIADMAIKLLENNPEIRNEYRDRIKEIMVDEYQDTNDLQEYFIKLIANDNLFMVGDMKQSIYAFRDANPKNFLSKYHTYKENNGGFAIDLRENFRSRREILEDINSCFMETMSEYIGGIDYQDGQSLVYGLMAYEKHAPQQNYGIEVAKYNSESLKEEDPEFDKMVHEARLIQKDISWRIEHEYQILDNQEFRNLRFSDIAILVDRKTDFEKLAYALSSQGIPVNIYSDEEFISSPEMLFLSSYLKLLKCFNDPAYLKQNYSGIIYSVARSFVYQISDQQIIDFLINEEILELADLAKMASYPGFRDIYALAFEISQEIKRIPVADLLPLIYQKLKLFSAISVLDNPAKKEQKLDYFALNLRNFSEFTFTDLIDYLEAIDQNLDWDIEYSTSVQKLDAVKLMTMHKSKGLQFPIVYLPGLGKKFNFQENQDFFIFDKNYGLISNVIEDGYYPTFLRNLYLTNAKREYNSERIRLLYVAFTRAKENLIFILDESDIKPQNRRLGADGYITNKIRLTYNKYSDLLSSTKLVEYPAYQIKESSQLLNKSKPLDDHSNKLLHKQFNFARIKVEKQRYSKSSLDYLDEESKAAMAYGDYLHELLKNINFYDLASSLLALPDNLAKTVTKLTESEVFRFDESPKIAQEMEFYDPNRGVGIIDLLLEYADEIIIIDYKLKSLADEAYITQLSGYRDFIMSNSDKSVKCYLYSLQDSVLKQII